MTAITAQTDAWTILANKVAISNTGVTLQRESR